MIMLVEPNKLLTVPDYARKIKVHSATVRELVRYFNIKPVKIAKKYYFYQEQELDSLFDKLRNIRGQYNHNSQKAV
jgi:hypothetical protein